MVWSLVDLKLIIFFFLFFDILASDVFFGLFCGNDILKKRF